MIIKEKYLIIKMSGRKSTDREVMKMKIEKKWQLLNKSVEIAALLIYAIAALIYVIKM